MKNTCDIYIYKINATRSKKKKKSSYIKQYNMLKNVKYPILCELSLQIWNLVFINLGIISVALKIYRSIRLDTKL